MDTRQVTGPLREELEALIQKWMDDMGGPLAETLQQIANGAEVPIQLTLRADPGEEDIKVQLEWNPDAKP